MKKNIIEAKNKTNKIYTDISNFIITLYGGQLYDGTKTNGLEAKVRLKEKLISNQDLTYVNQRIMNEIEGNYSRIAELDKYRYYEQIEIAEGLGDLIGRGIAFEIYQPKINNINSDINKINRRIDSLRIEYSAGKIFFINRLFK